ncbi:MAG: PAS domain S-box protein [Candidatus Methanoperedens sp.]|nr:PAS domain S-box protein [Candidatus Methanoperedens sp.]
MEDSIMLTDFFSTNLDAVFFIYGFAFAILGIIIFMQLRVTKQSEFKLRNILWLLGWFGFIHGINEFMDMFMLIKGELFFLRILGASALFISFLFLFLFGYQMINIGERKRLGIWFPFTIALLFVGLPVLSGAASFDTWNISSRYFLGFPGAILSAIGFLSYYKSEANKLREAKVEKYFILISLLFGLYAILGGWIVPQGNFYPASAINTVWFISSFGIPVQIFRALIAVGIAWSLWKIVNIFNIEGAADHKRADEKLRESEEKYRMLIDNIQDGVFIIQDDKVQFANESFASVGGYTVEEVIGKDFRELIAPDDLEMVVDNYRRRQAGEDIPKEYEFHMMHKNGRTRIIVNMNFGFITFRGRVASMGTVKDITQKKLLESQLLRAQRMESIGTLASGIAHDINNVLTPIMLSQELLQEQLTDKDSLRLLSTIKRSTHRGADLMKQVMSFAKGVEGERNTLQVVQLISEIRQIAKETFPRNIDIRTDIPKAIWNISGDSTQLHQILMNLCVNARDAMPDGGILRFCAENILIDEDYAHINIDAKIGPYIVITVSDTGTGIPPGILDRIFEPFFTTKEPGKGTGLGLSVALGIVKSHSGFITAYSEVGKGTAFKVYLPAITTAETIKAQEHQHELPAGHGESILVVDDEDQIREITRKTLETYGYRVITANDGKEAIALYSQHGEEIKLVLMDMMMPVMDGPVSIQELYKTNPEVKIIAVSGLTEKDKTAKTDDIQVQAFLMKPYTAEKLLNTIYDVLNTK